jgi:tartrate dehydrogenase/decarboxylase/D-malate dehydrogenase
MNKYRIAVIPGDNIGPEVTDAALHVLRQLERLGICGFSFETFGWGASYYISHGRAAPDGHVETLRTFDAILMGSHGDPASVSDSVGSQQLMHPIRQGLDLYVNHRPARLYPGIKSPLAQPEAIDLVVVRENTEGEYSNVGGRVHRGTPHEVGMQTTVVTRRGAERVMRYAFDLAQQRRKSVHAVTKSNALAHVMELWDEVFAAVAADYPDVRTSKSHVDAMAMYMINRPGSFDVIVASNLMGDIISDEAAAITGGIGLAASANLNPERTGPSMFEPVHGSAPDIAGRGVANPLASIGAAGLMLEWLGESEAARLVAEAIEGLLADGRVRTPDLGGIASTTDVTNAVVTWLQRAVVSPDIGPATLGR